MNGKLQVKTISKALVHKNGLISIAEILMLLGLGVLAVTLHAYLRYPLNLPGHHGMEFMALLIFGKTISRYRAASSVFSLGAGMFLLLPFLGIKDPFAPMVYMLPGFFIDFQFSVFSQWRKKIWFNALSGGIAYALIPLSRMIIMLITDYPYKSLMVKGPIFVIGSFFMFGLIGSVFTSSIVKAFKSTQ
jgi:hypothetical protein